MRNTLPLGEMGGMERDDRGGNWAERAATLAGAPRCEGGRRASWSRRGKTAAGPSAATDRWKRETLASWPWRLLLIHMDQ